VSMRSDRGSSHRMTTFEQRQIDWTTAKISGGALTVGLVGEAPKGWSKRFDGVLALLEQGASGEWGEISLHKKTIKVDDVQEGSEEDLRHLLESVLLQVNSDFEPSADHRRESSSVDEQDPQAEKDRSMADAFRDFAGPERVSDADEG
jgi:hypothetical protein